MASVLRVLLSSNTLHTSVSVTRKIQKSLVGDV